MRLLVLIVGYGFILWLLRNDSKRRQFSSPALWIPALWLAILGSRPPTLWASLIGISSGGDSNAEGSPVNVLVLLSLIVAAVITLIRRGFQWGAFAQKNKVLLLVYAYLVLSVAWSDDGVATFKRVVKDFGCVPVALVLLTDKNPLEAIKMIYVRIAYIFLPLSVLLIKYFPHIGRVPSRGGEALFCGVTTHKNTLGMMVFVFGLFVVADLITLQKEKLGNLYKRELAIRFVILAIGGWLLVTCDSVTSMICFLLGCFLLWGTGRLMKMKDPKAALMRIAGVGALIFCVESIFKISHFVLALFGRDATLTGRTEIWELVRATRTDPLFGVGFYSFWDTKGAQEISDLFLGTLSTVHNGYLEMYLDGGMIGVSFLLLLLLVAAHKNLKLMFAGSFAGRLGLVFLVIAIIYNNSETSFFRLEPLWFTLLATLITAPRWRSAPALAWARANAMPSLQNPSLRHSDAT